MRFFVGLHNPSDAHRFERCMISINRLRDRRGDFAANEWMLDSGAFTELARHGRYRHSVAEYAAQIRRWSRCGTLLCATAQDYMCEPFMLARTGLTVAEHQRLTIERYRELIGMDVGGVTILPVLQGYKPSEYVDHIRQYGDLLKPGMWVGVGSVCKRNASPDKIADVLLAIKAERPDLRLHGFGVKTTALRSTIIRDLLHTADSMAWSFAARREGGTPTTGHRPWPLSRRSTPWHRQSARISARWSFSMRSYFPLAAYIASIVLANILIVAVGPVPVGFGLVAPAGVYAAGLSLWLRDATQDALGHRWAVAAVLAGALLSAALSPALALASGAAFLLSELIDMAIYTPIRRRSAYAAVIVSNTAGLLVDSALFLTLAFGSLDYLPGQVVGKLWATVAALALMRLAQRRAPVAETAR